MAHWIITKDHLANKTVDIRSRGCPTDPASLKGWHQFRLYDDDGELYYTGFLFRLLVGSRLRAAR